MNSFLPYTKHEITAADIQAVTETLQSDFLTQGPKIAEFEKTLCEAHGIPHATVLSNATAALHVVYAALGLKPGEWVVTSPITFAATSNAALYCGAHVTFSDVDAETWCMSAKALDARLAQMKKEGKVVKIVSPVHFAGLLCDMEAIAQATHRHYPDAKIVEDAAHSVGVRNVCKHPASAAAILSFHPAKHVATGEGGAILTRDAKLHQLCSALRAHGISKDPAKFQAAQLPNPNETGPWYYEMQELGWNYRLPDMNCALGISQMKRLPQSLAHRRNLARAYREALKDIPWIQVQNVSSRPDEDHGYHLFPICIDYKKLGITRATAMEKLKAQGVGTQVHYIPVYRLPYYQRHVKSEQEQCPQAESYYAGALSLPMYATLALSDVPRVVAALKSLQG